MIKVSHSVGTPCTKKIYGNPRKNLRCPDLFSTILNVGHGLAMMWEVADTPGPFAMTGVQDISTEKCLFKKWAKKEGLQWQSKRFVFV
ncbi:hypothetical protein C7R92_18645 [Brevibacillus porteri]|uniref:Uncharacterized protein n=1 Tax=Brevibacillus porteri TaxID=2126350 RepID=A0ABX5FMD0_9BACL|nr:hypothetical protein C7R92_18645 [Brevibacillus porteri]